MAKRRHGGTSDTPRVRRPAIFKFLGRLPNKKMKNIQKGRDGPNEATISGSDLYKKRSEKRLSLTSYETTSPYWYFYIIFVVLSHRDAAFGRIKCIFFATHPKGKAYPL